jgi:hypothetical protein
MFDRAERVSAACRLVVRALSRVKFSFVAWVRLLQQPKGDDLIMANKFASEELLAAPLPELIKNLGLAVATANKELRSSGDEVRYTIPSAEIELRVAINVETSTTGKIEGGAKIAVFSVNASYAKTYGFKEEASSVIKLTLSAVPTAAAAGPTS